MPTDGAGDEGRRRAARGAGRTAGLVAGLVAGLAPLLLAGQATPPPGDDASAGVTIDVVVDAVNSARVHQRYRLAPDTASAASRLQYLARRCTTVEDVALTTPRGRVALAQSPNGPWVELGEGPAPLLGHDSAAFDVEYRVRWSGPDADIPLALLTRPIPRREGEREGAVTVRVTIAGAGATVGFPQLREAGRDDAGSRWVGRFVAIPSFVRVRFPARPSLECPPAGGGDGGSRFDDGGLTWRFWLLVGIMVAWVPLYLAWARRQTEHDA